MGTFAASFNGRQLTALTELFNNFHVFMPEVDENTVIALFACKLKTPLVVRNARTLCFIFHTLSEEFLISPYWQAVAERYACFVSLKGKPISRNTLSSATYCAVTMGTVATSSLITYYISILKTTK